MRHKGQGDVTKLPVWAQDRILLLERNLEYANAKIAELCRLEDRVYAQEQWTRLGYVLTSLSYTGMICLLIWVFARRP